LFPGSIVGLVSVPYLCIIEASGLTGRAKGSVASVLVTKSASSLRQVQHDQRPTGSLELREMIRSWRGPEYPRRNLVGKTPGPWKKGQGLIESGMS